MGHFPNDKNLSQTLIPSQELSIELGCLDPVQQPCAYKCGLWSSDCLGSKSWLCHLQAEIMLVKHSSSVWHIRGVCQMSDISIITAFQLGFLVHISLYFLTIAQTLGFFKLMLFPFLECRFFFGWKFLFFFFYVQLKFTLLVTPSPTWLQQILVFSSVLLQTLSFQSSISILPAPPVSKSF